VVADVCDDEAPGVRRERHTPTGKHLTIIDALASIAAIKLLVSGAKHITVVLAT
jgi:hypothetical protein